VEGDFLPHGPRHLAGEKLLALLALQGPQSRARLAATLWPEVTESQGRFYLRRSLMELRHRLACVADVLTETAGTLALALPQTACDLWGFDHALQQSDDATAVSLYRGSLLTDWDDDWIQTERMQREQEFLGALERLARSATTLQDAIIALKRLIALDPARESAWSALMEAQARRGDPAALMQTYRDLRLWLSENLRILPTPETTALYEQLLAEARRAPPPKIAFPTRSRLPLAPTALIGRHDALEQLQARFEETRLLTLVGTGGVGKTRLALATLESLQDDPRFSDGIAWVDLAALSDPSLVRARIATALELSETAELATLLANRKLLLALDNCEHLLDAIADEVDTLLTACPTLFFLATSREPLGLSSETIWRVPALAEDESFQLFQARAQKVLPGWQLTEQNRPLVRQLCQRLDDLPLAIELAAARLGSLPLSELVRRLDARFDLLTGGSRTMLRRQQTLRAAMDWSWELLTKDEQTALRQLAIFISPFSLDAGEVACPEGLTQLPALVSKSLIAFSPEHDSYRLLETVREYVMEQELGDAGRAARQRYLQYISNQAKQAVAEYFGPNRHYWHQRLEAAHDNIRLILSDAVQSHPELALELAGNLWLFWREQGYRLEGLRTLRQLLESGTAFPEALQGRAWLGAGVLAYETADYDTTYHALNEALQRAQRHQDGWAEGEALRVLGLAHWNQGHSDQARDLYLQSQACFVRCQHKGGQASVLASLGHLAWNLGQLQESSAYNRQSRALFQELGDEAGLAEINANLGLIARSLDDYSAARRYMNEALEARRRLGMRGGVAAVVHQLGVLSYLEARYNEAISYLKESAQHWRELGDPGWLALSLYYLGLVQKAQRAFPEAICSLSESLQLRRQQKAKRSIAGLQYALGAIWLEQKQYDDAIPALHESARLRLEIGLPVFCGESLDVLACLHARQGKADLAVPYLSYAAKLREGKDEVEDKHPHRDEATHTTKEALPEWSWQPLWEQGAALDSLDALLSL